jgi:hypothetical protein
MFMELMIRNTRFHENQKNARPCLEDIVIFYRFGVTLHKIAPVSTASRNANTAIPPQKHVC